MTAGEDRTKKHLRKESFRVFESSYCSLAAYTGLSFPRDTMPRPLQYYFSYPLGCVWQTTGQVLKVLVKGLKQYHIFHKKANN